MKISDIPPQDLRAAKKLYDDVSVSLDDVAARLNISKRSLYDHIHKWGWTPRAQKRRLLKIKNAEPSSTGNPNDDSVTNEMCAHDTETDNIHAQVDAHSLSRRLDEAVRRELVTVESRLRRGPVASAERNARVLTALVKAMAELARMERQEKGAERHDSEASEHSNEDRDEEPPADLAELRAELARRLERLRRSRHAGSV